jgi:hypothetical protein
MNRLTVILLAALDAVITLAVGLAIPLVPLTIAWMMQFAGGAGWTVFWRAACDIWLLGQGIDVTITMSPTVAAQFGLSGLTVFPITVAVLGFALLTAGLGVRMGRRALASSHPLIATVVGTVVFAVLSALLTLSAHAGIAVPSLLQGSTLPALVFLLGIGAGLAWEAMREHENAPQPPRAAVLTRISAATRAVLAAGVRGGVAASALVLAASAVWLAVLVVVHYGRVVSLYDGLQPGALGSFALTLGQLAVLPNAVIWTASWLAGPGFALGTGSTVNTLQTTVGPLPSVPLLGVLPGGDPGFGLVAVLLPVLCGVAAGMLTRRRLDRMREDAPAARAGRFGRTGIVPESMEWTGGRLALVTLLSAVLAGAALGLLAWWSAGAMGPGRLQHTGPNGFLVAGAIAAEVLVGCAIGIAVRRRIPEGAAVTEARPAAARASAERGSTERGSTERVATQRPSAERAAAERVTTRRPSTQQPSTPRVSTRQPVTQRPAGSGKSVAPPASSKSSEPSSLAAARVTPDRWSNPSRRVDPARATVAQLVEQVLADTRNAAARHPDARGSDGDSDTVTLSND